ncbi:restriction endonuclease [Bradyrhizobium roseum]|uniref:restriction endonuclease n=1 Tax=Bradyrhizobium roseum TaxID=3056648 RepID=UPI00261C68A6|nr:restriction endonuclease [Bradyrhizobium roseus]WKA31343.1 restriction endonuclease [Bradyrhizobium roseus]
MADKPKIRLNIDVSPELARQLEELVESFGRTSKTEQIRREVAVQLLKRTRDIHTQGSFALHTDIKPSALLTTGVLDGLQGVYDPGLREFLLKVPHHGSASTIEPEAEAAEKPVSTLVMSALIVPESTVADGLSIQTITLSWQAIVKHLEKNWDHAHEIPPEKWEEIIAGAFKAEGYDEVILTPRSGDDGRDVIAIRKGIGTVKILGSVKAYGPGRLVRHDDVRALVGVLAMEPDSSKGILTTTSDFAPKIYTNPKYAALMPTRLELVNGKQLQEWLVRLAKKSP